MRGTSLGMRGLTGGEVGRSVDAGRFDAPASADAPGKAMSGFEHDWGWSSVKVVGVLDVIVYLEASGGSDVHWRAFPHDHVI